MDLATNLFWIFLAATYLIIKLLVVIAKGPKPGSDAYCKRNNYDYKTQRYISEYICNLYCSHGLPWGGSVTYEDVENMKSLGLSLIELTDEELAAIKKFSDAHEEEKSFRIQGVNYTEEEYETEKELKRRKEEAYDKVKKMAVGRVTDMLKEKGFNYNPDFHPSNVLFCTN